MRMFIFNFSFENCPSLSKRDNKDQEFDLGELSDLQQKLRRYLHKISRPFSRFSDLYRVDSPEFPVKFLSIYLFYCELSLSF